MNQIGDFRLYCFERNSVIIRTLNYSVPQMLVQSKEIKEKDIRFHPDRNKTLKAIGTDEGIPRYQVSVAVNIADCQAFLLCSDGFWELISERLICRCLRKSEPPEEWLKRMKKVFVKKGKNKNIDNFSAIAIIVK